MHEDPCKVFCELAHTTWNLLGQCHALKIRLGEDAITTLLLTNIATRLSSTVLYADSRAREFEAGCDLELLIGSTSGGWCRYAIQAKRISIPTRAYNNLNHTAGRAKKSQLELLRTYAKNQRALPLYLFYNHLISAPPLYPVAFGCSLAPVAVVEKALATWGARNFDWIHRQPGTAHWANLVCPGSSWLPFNFPRQMAPVDMDQKVPDADFPEFYSRDIPADIREWTDQGKISDVQARHGAPLALAIIDRQG